ncbi:MAG: response regulator [Burkholderiaceae bacterium]|nr:response regulator [Burkholderiaceae bacterium]MCD6672349.1 response regulator [Burkholderiaceae bacterium]
MAEILVVDDEIGIRELLSEILGDEGHSVLLAESAQQARQVREENPIDLVLLDIWMPDTDGVTLLKEWASCGKLTMPVIMMSGHATIDTAVEATRIGALDFLEKPITLQKLLKAVETGLERGRGNDPNVAASPSGAQMRAVHTGYQASARIGITVPGAHAQPPMTLVHPAPAGGAGEGAGYAAVPAAAHVVAAVGGATIGVTPAHVGVRELPLDLPLREARDCFERAYFEHHLTREHGSMTRVAERTGLERTHLYRKLKQLGIDLSRGAYRKQGS